MRHDKGFEAALHVLVAPAAEGGYFAQGVEIDYVATGTTEEEAKDRFAKGFVETLRAYIERGRPLDGLFKSAPPAGVRQAYFASDNKPVFVFKVTKNAGIPDDLPVPRALNFYRSRTALPA